ncbi:MAG: hypothetical protein IKQ68_07420 [Prevotella sp.]|nr:hypothetical protein [Prevotella sp.]
MSHFTHTPRHNDDTSRFREAMRKRKRNKRIMATLLWWTMVVIAVIVIILAFAAYTIG